MKSNISFYNNRNEKIRGIVEEPKPGNTFLKKHIIIFPNCGLMGCEGDFRAYVRIAEQLLLNGFYVMRFSPAGVGLSDGNIKDCKQKDLFGIIETGLFVDDFLSAIDFAVQKYPSFQISLSGICGGAISALLTAAKSDFVNNVIAVSTPITLDRASLNYREKMHKEQAKFLLSTYFSKMFSPKAWLRFVTFQSDTADIKNIIKYLFIRNQDKEHQDMIENTLNPKFFKSALDIIKDKKNILFIYGDSDRAMWEFEDYFLKRYYGNEKDAPFYYQKISKGNHMLTWVEMQNEASEKMVEWLNTL